MRNSARPRGRARAILAPPPEIDHDPLGRAPLPTLAELGIPHNPALQRGGETPARERIAPSSSSAPSANRSSASRGETTTPPGAWVEGKTGYPVVDAAARQLLTEGFVHNRARKIAASFLTKHLLINFRRGEAHYMRLLTGGDLANNDLGWQWSAGCGCDAQPYFRIFNPVTQGKKFDPEGEYVRRWVPELATLDKKHIHAPWEAPEHELRAAGVVLGVNYPRPIVEHAEARGRFPEVANQHLG